MQAAAHRWTSTVVLGDGTTALIRPITPGDAGELGRFHAGQSGESRYLRFFSPKPTLSDEELQRYTTVDFVDRVAFVVEQHGEFIAWASYERWQNREDAEVAFMVADGHWGKGIATLLLEHLAAVAHHNGITRFTAQTLGTNRAMLAVFSKAGWPVHRRFESGVIDVDFVLDDTSEFIDSVERREQRADSRAMARLLQPSSIAVIGASDQPGTVGNTLWSNVVAHARCPVYAVNPRHPGAPDGSYGSVTDIPDEIGLAIIAVPAEALEATIDDCIAKRVRGAVVITVIDHTDIDVDGLVARARRNGLRLIGPASMGVASPRTEVMLQAALAVVEPPAGSLAVSMQSGSLGSSLLRLAHELQLGLSWFVSLGDKCDVSANDLLQFWEDDDATRVIAVYTESLGNPRKFARIARRVSARKPVLAVRTGAALVGAGNDALYRETGVIEVPTVTALLDTARVFATQPLMGGDRVAVLSNSRSPEVLAAATLAAAGLEVVASPVALDWRSRAADYATAVAAALAGDGVDAVFVVHAPPVAGATDEPSAEIDAAATGANKPVVAVMLGRGDGPLQAGSPVPSFAFPEQAAAALAKVADYSRWRRSIEHQHDEVLTSRIDRVRANAVIGRHLADGAMPPSGLRELLASYGVTMPPTEQVPIEAAVAAADAVGYPVALKSTHRRIGTSAEAGIALGLAGPSDVARAVAVMRRSLGDDARDVLVQPMVPPGIDLRVHITVDDRIGPVVTTGLGGVQADLIADESSRLAPVSPTVARALVASTRAAAVLDDDSLEAIADVVARVALLASDHPEIVELDLNPVIVAAGACHAVGGRIALRAPERPAPAVRRLE
ncbi:MAG TPA: GNAT family N-acetyltransferase [Ilumatobacter sp.]